MTTFILVIPGRDNKNLKFGLSCLRPTTDLFLALPASSSLKALSRTRIPILEIGKWKSMNAVYRIVAKIQKRYGIGDVFLFDDQDKYVAVSLKAVSRRRLEKILFNSDSLNLNACRKFGCTYFRVGSSIGIDGSVIQPAPKLIEILQSDLRGQASRPHFEFLASVGIKVEASEHDLCGPSKDKLELIHGIME